MGFQIYRVFHVLVTGIIVILISTFFGLGGIGENFTANPFPDPLWLPPIVVWVIGAVLSFMKRTVKIGLLISALPLLFYIVLFVVAYYS
ncbi:hypothetical protein [Sporosarcina sp. A2]|uniref:hypothetical protein n=1 Tax=Sporosarcina sp. A2 TaxID=3393449 RepID=UPI003D7BE0A3